MLLAVLLMTHMSSVAAHSWMSCPRPFNTNFQRGGGTSPPCEPFNNGVETSVTAGDRLKVGWTSNNHAGGHVRLSLIKATSTRPERYFGAAEEAFKKNVIKFACYGHDARPKGSSWGDCVHPCNGRPGCEYQKEPGDVERFDTTITIPTNLVDGLYILQAAQLVGNSHAPYYSCALLKIKGGDRFLDCSSAPGTPPTTYDCHTFLGTGPLSIIQQGTKRGEFCYFRNRRGEVDDRITEQPVNMDCDPREHCGLSANPKKCYEEPGMINLDDTHGDPKQPNCMTHMKVPTCKDNRKNQGETGVDCGGPCPPCQTCFDSVRNQDETGVDCGGKCAPCPTCFDGKQNQRETGVDCGGPCEPCSSCTDGVKNHGETGIDCGGSCAACASCSDRIQNQGEYGVDCGGPCCNTCAPTCHDGIRNQNESAVDCGGPCKSCTPAEAFDYIEVNHREEDFGGKYLHILMEINFLKDVKGKWKLRIEYNQKLTILSACGYGRLEGKSGSGSIFTFASNPWEALPKAETKRKIYLVVRKYVKTIVRATGVFFEIEQVPDERLTVKRENYRRDEGVPCGSTTCPLGYSCVTVEIIPCKSSPSCALQQHCRRV